MNLVSKAWSTWVGLLVAFFVLHAAAPPTNILSSANQWWSQIYVDLVGICVLGVTLGVAVIATMLSVFAKPLPGRPIPRKSWGTSHEE